MLGLDFAVFRATLMRQVGQMYPMRQIAPSFPGPGLVQSFPMPGPGAFATQGQLGQGHEPSEIISTMTALHEQHQLGNITDEGVAARNSEYLAALRSSSQIPSLFSPNGFQSPWPAVTPPSNADRFGSGPWPPTARPQNPITIYANEAGVSGFAVEPRWSALSEDQKAAYRVRSETLRHEAWAQQEATLAEGPSPFALTACKKLDGACEPWRRLPGVPTRPGIITGLSVFRDEQEIEWQEVLRRWEALTEEHRQVFEARAATANAAARATFREGRTLYAGCPASTQFPATVYFPAGTYLVSSPIIQFYNTEMLGDPFNRPVILAAESFSGFGVITSDVYVDDDVTWYLNQNSFFRSVRNFVIDLRPTPQWTYVCGIHWQVAQGTSLENIAFISTTPTEYDGTTQQGIYMENGSGGFMSDLVFVGGNFGGNFGNQQFTTSSMLFDSCWTGLQIHWDWGWTIQDTEFYNCAKGIVIVGGAGGLFSTGQGVGSLSLVDVHMWGVPVVIETSLFEDNSTALHIDNGGFQNCETIVLKSQTNSVLYPGDGTGLTNVLSWGFGKVADPSGETGFVNGANMAAPEAYPASLLVTDDIHPPAKSFHRTRPSYADPGNSQIFDVKALGAKGDGATDDTAVLNRILDIAANVSGIVYFPHGVYVIKDTSGLAHYQPGMAADHGHRLPVRGHGEPAGRSARGRRGVRRCVMEIQCMMSTVRGPTAGAVLVEWNVHESSQGSAGLWDSHIRVGGAKGSDLQNAECPKTAQNKNCIAASMMMHMTEKSSGYLENVWMWVADHDMEDADQIQINVYAARGILIESQGPTWLWGTAAEHAVLYQYQLSGAKNVVMGLIQTEAPYFQSSPKAPAPFEMGLVFKDDPNFADCSASSKTCAMAWSLRMIDSTNIYVISGGLYTWFQDYSQECVNSGANDCQLSTFYVEQSFDVWVYNLITIGVIQMVTALNGQPVSAANNRNGFASSIVTWLGGANQTAGGRNVTGYTPHTRDDLAGNSFSEQCKTALTGTIACVNQAMQWTSLGYRGSLDNATLQDEVCDVGCRSSLASWYQGVSSSCADYT
ncbi:putative glucan endo-1 3-beta-glucosidase [Colletotrichum gloeosporioides]|uniref:Putative glucan endo-1 3-beta-glucosidase n=1 Tax=Colletotrichum gloeosporioides TaxID=474922 RepID=A0A8H4FI82_COLGL|nr:putative glucan endo-1 3-beta-glucosidase [Colletotrichum gloeosporioides]KAF3801934.1 putative glucan endo-1 3-beta-glucosidase [Colletotrichum gloeosporioides]